MSLAEFEYVMTGVALRNGQKPEDEPSDDEFLDDLAAVAREEAMLH